MRNDLQKSRPFKERLIATHVNLDFRGEPREYACDRSKQITRRKRKGSATSAPHGLTTNDGIQKRGFYKPTLGSICVGQHRRAEHDGVLVANLGKSLLG
jgi:hypothetical protein